jgi:hypothetical protein
MNRGATVFLAAAALAFAAAVVGQQQAKPQPAQHSGGTPGTDMSDMQHETEAFPEAARTANDTMSDSAMNMDTNPHMYMTVLAPKKEGDDQRAAKILGILRQSIAKYRDYHAALADGYEIFLPKVSQKQYHFTNYRYAFAATFVFNPARPASLLYRKTKDSYELVGAMYTAAKNATEEDLNSRVPLSVARWHEHVNFCMPPKGTPAQQVDWKQFGLAGSIATQGACSKAGGRWIPQIFGWMFHVYPFESDATKTWAH